MFRLPSLSRRFSSLSSIKSTSASYPYPLYFTSSLPPSLRPPQTSSSTSLLSVTFLPIQRPQFPSNHIIGWIPAASTTDSKQHSQPEPVISSKDFIENPSFIEQLHQFLKSTVHKDQKLLAMAAHQKEGWMNVPDERNPAPWGRIPDPDDIFGHVLIQSATSSISSQPATIVVNSYQAMPSHRLVSYSGLFVLPESLHQLFVQRLSQELPKW